MKQLVANLSFCLLILLAAVSCKKDAKPPVQAVPPVDVRTIRYILYSLKDFSGATGMITFDVIMKNGNKVIWDSTFAPMKISAIPYKDHAVVVDKPVPAGNDTATLTVGFLYSIQDVGNSWYLDTCAAGQVRKYVEYNFQ